MVIAERRVGIDQTSVQERYSGVVDAGLKAFLQKVDRERNPDIVPFPITFQEAKEHLEGVLEGISPYVLKRIIWNGKARQENILNLEEKREGKKLVDFIINQADEVRLLAVLLYVNLELGKRTKGKVSYIRPSTKDVILKSVKMLGTDPLALGIKNPNETKPVL